MLVELDLDRHFGIPSNHWSMNHRIHAERILSARNLSQLDHKRDSPVIECEELLLFQVLLFHTESHLLYRPDFF